MTRNRFPNDVMDFLQTFAELPLLLVRLNAQMEANSNVLQEVMEQLGNTRLYEKDAAKYLHVNPQTMYSYRQRGLNYEKVGRIISYRRKDLDDWRTAGKTRKVDAM